MATHILKFGEYTFSNAFTVAANPNESRLGTIEVPRRDGVMVGDPTLREKIVQVRGMLRADTPDALRTAMDALLLAVNSGRQKLYLWDDRFTYATKTGFTTDYDPASFERYCNIAIDFLCDTPLWEAEEPSSDTWSSPVSGSDRDISVGGNVYVLPLFEITVDGTGALDIEIGIGDISFTLEGEVADGDVILVDCAEESAELLADYSDYMSVFDGTFLTFAGGGTNQVTYTKNGGTVNVSQIVTRWRDRWY